MISKQFTPDFHHSLGKDYPGGMLSAQDKPLDDWVKVHVPSQHQAVVFASQFHSLIFFFFFPVKRYHKLEHTRDGMENAELQSSPVSPSEPGMMPRLGQVP